MGADENGKLGYVGSKHVADFALLMRFDKLKHEEIWSFVLYLNNILPSTTRKYIRRGFLTKG